MKNFILLLLTQLALLSAHLVDIVEFSTYHHVVMAWEQTKYNSPASQLVNFGRLVPRHVSAVVLLDFCCFDLDAFPGRSMRRANLKRLWSESAHISRTESAHVSRTIPHFVPERDPHLIPPRFAWFLCHGSQHGHLSSRRRIFGQVQLADHFFEYRNNG